LREARARRAREAAAHEGAEYSRSPRPTPDSEGSVTEDDSNQTAQTHASEGSITEDDSGAEAYAE